MNRADLEARLVAAGVLVADTTFTASVSAGDGEVLAGAVQGRGAGRSREASPRPATLRQEQPMERDARERVERLLAAIDRIDVEPATPNGVTNRYAWQLGHLRSQVSALRMTAGMAREALNETVPA